MSISRPQIFDKNCAVTTNTKYIVFFYPYVSKREMRNNSRPDFRDGIDHHALRQGFTEFAPAEELNPHCLIFTFFRKKSSRTLKLRFKIKKKQLNSTHDNTLRFQDGQTKFWASGQI